MPLLLKAAIRFTVLGTAFFVMSCGPGGPMSFTAPDETHRGEADAVNPARHVTVTCAEKDKNVGTVTTNITNNCDKSSVVAAPPAEE